MSKARRILSIYRIGLENQAGKSSMKVKKVNRYYCEYCKKSGCSGYWMKKHEQRCTMNPNRTCGYCDLLNQPQPEISDLLAILPDPKEYVETDDENRNWWYSSIMLDTHLEEAMPKLRELAGNCPACIMSALRQKGIPVPMAQSFDFKVECQKIWDEVNSENLRKDEESNWSFMNNQII